MHSTLFTIFGIPIRAYGLMMVVGFAMGLWHAKVAAKRRGFDPDRIYDLSLIALLSGIVGARLLYIVLNPDTESFKDFFAVWNGGLSFHGGVLSAVIAAIIYTRWKKLSFLECADLLSPSLAIAYAFTRIGCFLNGCCYGVATGLPWGVRFLEDGQWTAPSHPTQIYASIANTLIFVLLTRLEKLNRAPGFIFVSYLGLYSAYRFLVEFLRVGTSAKLWLLSLTQAQWASLIILGVSAALVFTVYRKAVKKI
ncbi:MAG: prolipoprotein diacylglyceryl transferase [Armatimonadetes bacterium]|nr:prolipoprotein diacylglyceryl transferase [Armatimonadota bacterium]